jgi:hypothetical protein
LISCGIINIRKCQRAIRVLMKSDLYYNNVYHPSM